MSDGTQSLLTEADGSDGLTVLTGLPGTGKTSFLISSLKDNTAAGREVELYLSAESSLLTSRPNVRPGGIMGCRDPNKRFVIDYVLKTDEAIAQLEHASTGSVAAFDEAQYFQPHIVDAWVAASRRGVNVIASTPSASQIKRLETFGLKPTSLNSQCVVCGKEKSTVVIYKANLKEPTQVCDGCDSEHYEHTVQELLSEVRDSDPFKGENKTYQPFYNINMPGWTFVRGDSLSRFEIIRDALANCPQVQPDPANPGRERTYVDVGCCSGFFCDAFTSHGFTATGVDVTKNFIEWARRVALLKRQSITYFCEDAEKFLTSSDSMFDVTSSFATIQWVMAQRGYEHGVNCFKSLFKRTRHVCIVEMGYSTEEIYKTKILDRPSEIDKDWVMAIMKEHGGFEHIEFYPSGHRGIWRDIFIGYKKMPASIVPTPTVTKSAGASVKERIRRLIRR